MLQETIVLILQTALCGFMSLNFVCAWLKTDLSYHVITTLCGNLKREFDSTTKEAPDLCWDDFLSTKGKIGELLTCPVCLSGWVALIFAILMLVLFGGNIFLVISSFFCTQWAATKLLF